MSHLTPEQFSEQFYKYSNRRVLGRKLWLMSLAKGFTFGLWPSDAAYRREQLNRRLELLDRLRMFHAHTVLNRKEDQ